MILKMGELRIAVFETSDIILLLLAVVLACNILICLVFCACKYLEKILNMRQLNIFLKTVWLYILAGVPFVAFVSMYKAVYSGIKAYNGDDGIDTIWRMSRHSLSEFTVYGNHWVFVCLLTIWLAGVVISGVIQYKNRKRLVNALKDNSYVCEDEALLKIKSELQESLRIKNTVKMMQSDRIDSPFVLGSLTQTIFLPEEELPAESVYLVIKHELVHCKKYDCLYRRAVDWVCRLYWFNPFLRKLAAYFMEINEMACDEFVLEKATKKEKAYYAKALVELHHKKTGGEEGISLIGHSESQLERRLKNMIKIKTAARTAVMICLIFTLSIAGSFTAFAASFGVSEAQDKIARELSEEIEVAMQGNMLEEHVEEVKNTGWLNEKQPIEARGATEIQEEISGKDHRIFGEISISAGDDIAVVLKGDPSDASFRAGYINSKEIKTYVNSSGGQIFHTFSMSRAGEYNLFIENLSSKKITVTGSSMIY